jgi:signal transduction histidine kinase
MVLRVLHLEDDPRDRELVADTLRAAGLDCAISPADSQEAFERALTADLDVILADYNLPSFDGAAALELVRRRDATVPFVFVSGSIGEQRAVESLRKGATDYVFKGHLDKLVPAIQRMIREADNHRERARVEEELRQLNAALEARIDERTRDLTASNEALHRARVEAERANDAKSDFLSRMSHDLRTPLNAVMGFGQLLQLDPLAPEQAESVEEILRAGGHLLGLIDEILDLARIESGRLTLSPEPVCIGTIVAHAAALVRPMASQRGITLTIGGAHDVYARADRHRLNQVLLNLLSNAIKYKRQNGTVTIHMSRIGDRVRIDVADTGGGIPAERLSQLFTPFERLGADESGIEGTGLGLALSNRLVEAMNGTLTVDSVIDQGCVFHVELRASDGAASDAEQRVTEERIAATDYAATILYVEDNRANVDLMRRILNRRPRVVLLHAPDGRTALEMVQSLRPDFVLLDLHIPAVPGEEVLRRMRADPATRDIPVAALSADASGGSRRRLLASGQSRSSRSP